MSDMINHMIQTVERAIRCAKGSGKEYMGLYWQTLLDDLKHIQNGIPYILVSYYIPRSILAMFNIPVLYMEKTAGWGCVCNVTTLQDTGCKSICSYQQYLHGMLSTEIIPLPEYIIAADISCDDALQYCRHLAEVKKIPIIEITLKKGQQYTALQLEEIYQQLQKKFFIRREMKEIVQNMSAAMTWKSKIEKLHKEDRYILSGQDCMNLFPIYNDLGLPTTIKCLQSLYDECKKTRKCKRISQKYRFLWLGTSPIRASLLQRIENEFNCLFIYTELFHFPLVYITEENFFDALAEQIHNSYFCYLSNRIQKIIEVIKEFGINGIIHFSQRKCKLLPAMVPKIREVVEEQGIPILELIGDGMENNPDIDDYLEKVRNFIDEF